MSAPAPDRFRGTIKWFDSTKGYGFIARGGGACDVFLHAKQVPESCEGPDGVIVLDPGQVLTFETEESRQGKGPRAVNVVME